MYDEDDEWHRERRRLKWKIVEILGGFLALCVLYVVIEMMIWDYIASFKFLRKD